MNGKEHETDLGKLSLLIQSFELKAEHVVAEVDGHIIDRSEWEHYELKPGAVIELVHFVGGG